MSNINKISVNNGIKKYGNSWKEKYIKWDSTNIMTFQELRFFSIYLSQINARDISTRIVRFKLEDFKRIMDLKEINTQYFEEVTNSLLGKVVKVQNGDEIKWYTRFQLFKRCKLYRDKCTWWSIASDIRIKEKLF